MRRREIIAGLAAALCPLPALAERSAAVPRIGYLAFFRQPLVDSFLHGLRELGYVEGQTILIEYAIAEGRRERIAELARGLVAARVDVIVAVSNLNAIPAAAVTGTVPIVVLGSHDGVGVGLYQSLARPGWNVTGIEGVAREMDLKRIEILRSIVPTVSDVAILFDPHVPGVTKYIGTLRSTLAQAGIRTIDAPAGSAEAISPAVRGAVGAGANALLTLTDPLTFLLRREIAGLAAALRLPSIFESKPFVDAGGLASYGADLFELWRQGARYVDRILRGSKPSELPVERAHRFTSAVNLRTARLLGLDVPPAILAFADEVIE